MVDDKKCYLFGRNSQMNDFCIDHASCSRAHASFVYHKHLNITYLVDLGSTHGTFVGTLRLEAHKPIQLQINSQFHFGASTRNYILRERPSAGQHTNIMEDLPISETGDGALLGLPESQTELDNLTEYNTAHNRRISMLGIDDDTNMRKQNALKQGRRDRNVTFNDEEIVINPEDVDPNVGRNLVQTTVPAKRSRYDLNHMGIHSGHSSLAAANAASVQQMFQQSLAENKRHQHRDLVPLVMPVFEEEVEPTATLAQKLAVANAGVRRHAEDPHDSSGEGDGLGPQKKKYAKEAWPGRKPMLGQL
ncbi:nuclear inhibitor of protein phosphatase 1-like isoform X2 [Drosophila miranda]|nr:nuclear inhibitor of protein phosphatase 1-like isoform X2 [Drosophila miranda]